jgi:hypothetical protein
VYFTDRGLEELQDRRGDEQVTLGWLAQRLREFIDLNPDAEAPVDRLASWLARLDEDEESHRGAARPPGRRAAPPTDLDHCQTRYIVCT